MNPWLWPALAALAVLNLFFVLLVLRLLWRQPNAAALRSMQDRLERSLMDGNERLERELRVDVQGSASGTRQELAQAMGLFQNTVLAQSGETARTHNEQIDAFRAQIGAMQQQIAAALQGAAQSQAQHSQTSREALDAALRRFADSLGDQVRALSEGNERRLGEVRQAVEAKLAALQESNEKKLEQMRATVDEKLQSTLDHRLGESFKQVAERLEQVHRGLGEMQNLARDVGSLNRVLTNVKSRGVFGEVQLGGLLEQVFTVDQYATNVSTVPGSSERVEYAIRLPGQRADGVPLWLPIDAKFPREDYERLLEAHERADLQGVETAAKAIESRLRAESRSIRDKYIAPPHTTDFAILFVPTEGLYAEALRRPGLVEAMQREYKVMLTGPTTLLATLTSLQMGFRTLALEKRSTEVWEVLGAVKTEFGKFGDVLKRTHDKLTQAANTISAAQTRTRQMDRALKSVEALPSARAVQLLPGGIDEAVDESDDTSGA